MGTITAGGVLKKDGKYLLVQEAKAEYRGKWNLPAGRVQPGETIYEGAKREIREECGYDVNITGIVDIRNDKLVVNEPYVGFVFSTEIIGQNSSYDNVEILDTKWFTYDEILQMRDQLRYPDAIIDSITAVEKNTILDLNNIKIVS
ncbi:NUDIX domain-containing protein [Candidatus Saccharibacteria bacterium]|nr:NUDIX domain-containing protein [Candidatus Saccharibacteria bacterium]